MTQMDNLKDLLKKLRSTGEALVRILEQIIAAGSPQALLEDLRSTAKDQVEILEQIIDAAGPPTELEEPEPSPDPDPEPDPEPEPVPPAPKGYEQDLAYGGIMLGAACHDGAPGNQLIRNQKGRSNCAVVMYLEHMDPIVAIQTENRVDHFPLGATPGGYSDHNVVRGSDGKARRAMPGDTRSNVAIEQAAMGGDLRWRLARVTSKPSTSRERLELEKSSDGAIKWAGQTRVIKSCGQDQAWNGEWQRSGGSGDAPPAFAASNHSGAYPTIWFEEPIDPVALGWKIGDRIAFCPENSAPDSGPKGPHDNCLAPPFGNSRYSSVNMAYRADRPLRKSTYPYLAYCGLWWNNFTYDARYFPIMLVGHRGSDGNLHVKGNAYCGYAGAHELRFGGSVQIRQIIRIPEDPRWAGHRIRGCDAGIWCRPNATSGGVTMSLRRATAGRIGDRNDQGMELGSKTWSAAGELLWGDLKGGSGDPHCSLVIDNGPAVQPGEAYYITLTPTSGSAAGQFAVGRMLNYLGRAPRGLLKADHQNDADRFQAKSGDGSWDNLDANFGSGNYLHLGVSLFFRAG